MTWCAGHGDPEAVAEQLRYAVHDRGVPTADEHRGDRAHIGLEPASMSRSMPRRKASAAAR